MKWSYARFNAFRLLLAPFSSQTRRRRMAYFSRTMRLRDRMSVLDLGGQPMIWDGVSCTLDITILNLPGIAMADYSSRHSIRYVEGDACAADAYGHRSFDLVFSNSVIEHVGDAGKRAAFAHEVRRLGRSYWVQTPSKWFPIEAHCGMPFWWFYPQWLRAHLIERWRGKLPAWTEMVEGTTVLTRGELERLFPEAAIWVERWFGMPKSYVAYSLMGADAEPVV